MVDSFLLQSKKVGAKGLKGNGASWPVHGMATEPFCGRQGAENERVVNVRIALQKFWIRH